MVNKNLKVVLIHGNGGGTAAGFWFPSVKESLEKMGLTVIARDYPDKEIAHESIWVPFLKNEIKADENTIIVGHSSGGVAAMRYAEKNKIYGSVLVGVNHTDLGDATEKESGYYDRPWEWEKIKANQNWIIQFASIDDPYIPIEEERFISEKLGSEYHEFTDRGHFMTTEFPELVEVLRNKLQ